MKAKKRLNFSIPLWWPSSPGWRRLARALIPHPGTLIVTLVVLAAILWAQSVGALSLRAPAASSTSTGTIAYQGRLADADGTPITDTVNMEFRLYDVASGGVPLWDEQWTGSNAVRVSDGLFNVMLGSLTPIPQSVIAGHDQLFLGITVGTDDEMTPRVQLGSVPFAVQALTVPDGSITTAKIADGAVTTTKLNLVDGNLGIGTPNPDTKLHISNGTDANLSSGSGFLLIGPVAGKNIVMDDNEIMARDSSTKSELHLQAEGGDLTVHNNQTELQRFVVKGSGNVGIGTGNPGEKLHVVGNIQANGNLHLDLGGGVNPRINFQNNDSIEYRDLDQPGTFYLNADGGTGNAKLKVGQVIQGATVESNLLTPDELESGRISRFSQGDLLCWDTGNERLEKCAEAASRLVVAVADESGKPIVLGVEPIKVLGPVQAGDLLVASDVAGYATVNNQPAPGTAIAKALETFDGEKGLVKAMIRTP